MKSNYIKKLVINDNGEKELVITRGDEILPNTRKDYYRPTDFYSPCEDVKWNDGWGQQNDEN